MTLGRWRTREAMMCYLREAPIIRAAEAAHQMAKATAGPASAAAVEVDMVPPPRDRQAVAFGAEEMLVQHGITGILHKPAAVSGPAHTWSTRCGWKWAEKGLAGKFRAGQCCGTCFRP